MKPFVRWTKEFLAKRKPTLPRSCGKGSDGAETDHVESQGSLSSKTRDDLESGEEKGWHPAEEEAPAAQAVVKLG